MTCVVRLFDYGVCAEGVVLSGIRLLLTTQFVLIACQSLDVVSDFVGSDVCLGVFALGAEL